MKRYSYYKVASVTSDVYIGDPFKNEQAILDACKQLDDDVQLVVFPELCLTGYTCQDLFYENLLLDNALAALEDMLVKMKENLVMVVSLPLRIKNKLYNCAAVCFDHEVLGIQAKTYIPSYNEFYETRWFSSGKDLHEKVIINGKEVVVCNDLVVKDLTTNACIGVEICEDLWVADPVSTSLCLAGANIICNPSASNEVIAKSAYRLDLVKMQIAKNYCAYIYSSAGNDESSSDLVFSGHDIICENGSVLNVRKMNDEHNFIMAEIDLDRLNNDRLRFKTSLWEDRDATYVTFSSRAYDDIELSRKVDAYPFVLQDDKLRIERCQDIINIQAHGLATRLKKINGQNVVSGISGGLDSTLAVLVCEKAFRLNHLDPKGIHAITMPGFGTTSRTKNNADKLMELLHVSSEEISIVDSAILHLKDIGHDINIHDITYENAQARERTQILMDLANKYNGFVVGTGDLSELALGWCTYNGDHMSMYAVNVSVPKTLVRYIVESEAISALNNNNKELHDVLIDICDTPVSPELLPPDASGKITQKTEEVLGSYDLHDFFMYYMLRFHKRPKEIYDLCCIAFKDVDKEVIKKAINTFYNRFFSQQFKRNCMPDGVKVGSICFSPRGDWRMPSDASRNMWIKDLEEI